jgi:hypothetical protein
LDSESFVNKFVCYLKAPILTYSIQQEHRDNPLHLDDDFFGGADEDD